MGVFHVGGFLKQRPAVLPVRRVAIAENLHRLPVHEFMFWP